MRRFAMLMAAASVLCLSEASAYSQGAACVMFEDKNFGKRALGLEPDEQASFRAGQFWNDRASSIIVQRGCTLVAYEDTRMGGRVREFKRRIRNLTDVGWNDRISSAECYCDYRY